MTLEPVEVRSLLPSGGEILAQPPASGEVAQRDENDEIAMQIERAYPGYHVWISDAGWWYATRTHPRARGQSPTVHGPGPGELSTALAEEEAVTLGRAMGGAR
jgi:hypothetical protein